MIAKRYDEVTISKVEEDLVRNTSGIIDNVTIGKLGVNESSFSGTFNNNSLYITNSSIKVVKNSNTLEIVKGTFSLPYASIDSFREEGTPFEADVVISVNKVYKILGFETVASVLYNATKNIIVINKHMQNLNFVNEMLNSIISYNKDKKIVRGKIDKEELMLGTDPEFALTENNSLIAANSIIRVVNNTEDVGCDGHAATGEFRPQPNRNPYALARTMKKLYTKLGKIIDDSRRKNILVVSGGGAEVGKPLGGHIHFNIPPSSSLIQMLDDFIGKPLKNMKGGKRGGGAYGALGDSRPQPHGFEYRTPPSFIGDPKVFTYTMAVAKCVAETWIDLYNGELKKFSYYSVPNKDNYMALTGADKYKVAVSKFFEFVSSDKSNLFVNDALAAWKVKKDKVIRSKDVKKEFGIEVSGSAGDINLPTIIERVIAAVDGVKTTSPIKVYLYGISDGKGIEKLVVTTDIHIDVASTSVSYVTHEDMSEAFGFYPSCAADYDVLIGIPRWRRNEHEIDSTITTICAELSKYVRRT